MIALSEYQDRCAMQAPRLAPYMLDHSHTRHAESQRPQNPVGDMQIESRKPSGSSHKQVFCYWDAAED
jgi:hypothetical protein